MQPLPHHYAVRLSAGPTGYADLLADGLPHLKLQAPPEFGGPGDAWSPETLLLAAVQGCFLLTFRAVAAAAQVPFESMSVETWGTLDRNHAALRFTEIVVTPTITVPQDTDLARVRRLVEKAEQACLITASLSTPVRVDATLVHVPSVAA